MNERHVLGLDLIRFAAASMVMAFHFSAAMSPIPLGWTGWVGVEVFFVLSGYVIAYSAEGATAASFGRSRVVRLLPGVLICATAALAICAALGDYPTDLLPRYARSLVLWPLGTWIDGAYWTLPVEIAFYALVAVTLTRAPLSLPALFYGLAVLGSVYWALRLADQFHAVPSTLAAVVDGAPVWAQRFGMLWYGCFFAAGGLFRLAQARGWTAARFAALAASLLAGVVMILFTGAHAGRGVIASMPHAQKIVPALIWLALCAAMAASVRLNAKAWRLLAPISGPIRLLGLATYPVYLLHESIGNALIPFHALHSLPIASVLSVAAGLVVAAFLEPLAQALLRAALGGRPRAPVSAQPAFQADAEPS